MLKTPILHWRQGCTYCMVVKTGSSSLKNTKGSSLYPNSLIFFEGGGLKKDRYKMFTYILKSLFVGPKLLLFFFICIYNQLRVISFHLLVHELSATHPHIPSGLAPASWPTEAPSGVSSASLSTFSSWLFLSTFSVEPSGGRCGVSPGDGASLELLVWAAELDSLESFLSWRWKRRRVNGQRKNSSRCG